MSEFLWYLVLFSATTMMGLMVLATLAMIRRTTMTPAKIRAMGATAMVVGLTTTVLVMMGLEAVMTMVVGLTMALVMMAPGT